jgi:hypothetical protein
MLYICLLWQGPHVSLSLTFALCSYIILMFLHILYLRWSTVHSKVTPPPPPGKGFSFQNDPKLIIVWFYVCTSCWVGGWGGNINVWVVLHSETVCKAESFEWFIEDQSSSPSYDLAPLPPPPPSPVSKLYLFLSLPMSRWSSLHHRQDGGGGGGAKSYDGKKVWSYINHSVHSGIQSMSRARISKQQLFIHLYFPFLIYDSNLLLLTFSLYYIQIQVFCRYR